MSGEPIDCPLRAVAVPTRSFDRYRPYAVDGQFDQILERAARLRGLRVVEINSTPSGGGVATMLHSILPALRALGLDATWYSMCPDRPFFQVTKNLSNHLQGSGEPLTQRDRDLFQKVSEKLAIQADKLAADVLVVHCPQPAGLLRSLRRPPPGAIWRGHIDLAQPDPETLAFLEPYLRPYQLIVLEIPAYSLPGLPASCQRFVADAIDPLTTKNRLISRGESRRLMAQVGIDAARPVVAQVARFDHRKDPIGVVVAYREARRSVPGLQLALLGAFVAQDDPTAEAVYEEVKRFVGEDPNVHLYTNPKVIGQPQVDAFQTGSDAILMLSRKEGFGIAATEAMWKSNAVIAGDVGGLRVQIENEVNGFLVSDVESCAQRIVELVKDRPLARRIGERAHQTVRDHYLLPRLIDDWLRLFTEVSGVSRAHAA